MQTGQQVQHGLPESAVLEQRITPRQQRLVVEIFAVALQVDEEVRDVAQDRRRPTEDVLGGARRSEQDPEPTLPSQQFAADRGDGGRR